MGIGKAFTLKVKNAGKKKVVWSSTNKKVATVSKKGVVRGKKAGKTTIKAKISGKFLSCKVTVTKKILNVEKPQNTEVPATTDTCSPAPTDTCSPAPTDTCSPAPTSAPVNENDQPTSTPVPSENTATPAPTGLTGNPSDGQDEGWVPGWY